MISKKNCESTHEKNPILVLYDNVVPSNEKEYTAVKNNINTVQVRLKKKCWHNFPSWFRKYIWISFYLAFVVGFIGINCASFALGYVDPLIWALFGLMNPVAATFVSFSLELDPFPSFLVLIGGVIILSGICLLKVGEFRRKKKEKLNEQKAVEVEFLENQSAEEKSDGIELVDQNDVLPENQEFPNLKEQK